MQLCIILLINMEFLILFVATLLTTLLIKYDKYVDKTTKSISILIIFVKALFFQTIAKKSIDPDQNL